MKKLMSWKTKGMNRDLSVSAFNPEFAFENRNLRLSTNEANTMLSWVNEKGTRQIKDNQNQAIKLKGTAIGTAVLNRKLVVFTTKNTSSDKVLSGNKDYIYVLKFTEANDSTMVMEQYYNGNLNFSTKNPLETLVSYESDTIQKVYWTDGRNQPRMINIGVEREYYKVGQDTQFDFIPVQDEGTISATRQATGGGLFAPGVIQYAFTYFNKYGQQSNIVQVTPLLYCSHADRGASPEDKVSCAFKIYIDASNKTFTHVRLYSIQRTSLDAVPIVKHLEDFPVGTISYTDYGTSGASMDPTELFYVGGKSIKALTMTAKDQTLFFGNITEDIANAAELQNIIQKKFKEGEGIYFTLRLPLDYGALAGTYSYKNQLFNDSGQLTTFKGGEHYLFGIQFQKETGEWTEPIVLDEATNPIYPHASDAFGKSTASLASCSTQLDLTGIQALNGYKAVRPLVSFPTLSERRVLCQGVLNPTVFNVEDRKTNSPFAQASWYFRPIYKSNIEEVSAGKDLVNTDLGVSVAATSPQGFGEGSVSYDSTECTLLIGIVTNVSWIISKGIEVVEFIEEENGWYGTYFPVRGVVFLGNYNEDPQYPLYLVVMRDKGITEYVEEHSNTNFYYDNFTYQYPTYPVHRIDQGSVLSSIACSKAGYLYNPNSFPYYMEVSGSKGDKYYITFAANTANPDAITTSATTVEGSLVRFKHYASLYTTSDLVAKKDDEEVYFGNAQAAGRQVEIQGSIKNYERVNGEVLVSTDISNTQFFVDQSIVTFHSPELEFDTDIQNLPTEGLKLRVVGAVPIKAGVSSHSIITKNDTIRINLNEGVSSDSSVLDFGLGELSRNTACNYQESKTWKRLVSEYLWDDGYIKSYSTDKDDVTKITTDAEHKRYLVYPWQRRGSLNNDNRAEKDATAWLETKKESNLLFSGYTYYFTNSSSFVEYAMNASTHLTENEYIHNMRVGRNNYYPNIDKVLYNRNGYDSILIGTSKKEINSPISMKYKSTSHMVMELLSYKQNDKNYSDCNNALLPCTGLLNSYSGIFQGPSTTVKTTVSNLFWDGTAKTFMQPNINTETEGETPGETPITNMDCFLWLGDVINENAEFNNKNGQERTWVVSGLAVPIEKESSTSIYWHRGDTYYQRYDCLKTYPFTKEDTNQLVEILSFMCESRINLDGRYDRNRGQVDNTNMSPTNFNLLNPVYSQKDNFFSYKRATTDAKQSFHYPNQLTFTLPKESGADIDKWTNITLASTLELDGDKGEINSLQRLNNNLIAFQDRGISQILYNENTQISTTEGVPIELANSGKVQGKRYLSDSVGCSNKWSIVNTPSGIYFMDSNEKSIYLFNGQLQNVSTSKGMNSWCKLNIPSYRTSWNPEDFGHFVSYYDQQNQDVLFINNKEALAFSEKVGAFTSFYDYGHTPYFNNLDDIGVWLKPKDGVTTVWEHQAGQYCNFFGENKPYSMTLVGNPEPQLDKVFTNLEFRATVDGEGVDTTYLNEDDEEKTRWEFFLPFDRLEAWNEYQRGGTFLKSRFGHPAFTHHGRDMVSSLKRKFRIWRCDIPRNNIGTEYQDVFDETFDMTFYGNLSAHPNDRLRNPWIYLSLVKKQAEEGNYLPRTEIHDLVMSYYI